ncbi:MAG: hypothetical protein IT371_31270 [Deltaproteobacteria bacterium]|nr:hypothetical protein [Deltaproteobacteria bacterium]
MLGIMLLSTAAGAAPPEAPADPLPGAYGAFRGDVRSRRFHRAGCKHFRCPHCTAVFKSVDEALEAGYRPCPRCRPLRKIASSALGVGTKSPERVCQRHRDCELVPVGEPCACVPCASVSYRAVNKGTAAQVRAQHAAARCKKRCRCKPKRLGVKALCVAGQCTAQ